MDEHDFTHAYQSQQDQEVCYDHMAWSNTHIGIYIMQRESDRMQSAQSMYAEVYIYTNKGILVMELQFCNEAHNNKERKITKLIILREAHLR